MSSGEREDRGKTEKHMKEKKPCANGKNWLRHREASQAALIDDMLLEGKYSLGEMASELNRRFGQRPASKRNQRIMDHIRHLRTSYDEPDYPEGQKGHGLQVEEIAGARQFVM
jgi:hypothetical protein